MKCSHLHLTFFTSPADKAKCVAHENASEEETDDNKKLLRAAHSAGSISSACLHRKNSPARVNMSTDQ